MKKAFEKINAENAFLTSQAGERLLMDVFYKINKQSEHVPHLVILTQKAVLYYTNNTKTTVKRLMPFEFSCKFEIIKEFTHGPIGIRFEREGCKPYELYLHDAQKLVLWERQLEKHINKRGFHEEFKPIKKIGKGNFAAVYLATRLRDQARVAVKAFSKQHIFTQEKGRQSLINEIKLLRAFNHPNILHLLAVYQSINSVYLVLELLEGRQLFNVIENHNFSLKQIQDIMKGLLSGASEMARKNVVHRDLKPQNITFRTGKINSEIVILDFGLATFCDEKEYIYTRCGTPGFVSPQIVNIKDLTTKNKPISDIFSLGVIFHILLVGKSPFKGKTFNEVLSENRQCNFTLQGPQYSVLPNEAYDLLQRMLEKNPQKRISAQDCLQHPFLGESMMEVEEFETSVKNPQELRIQGSSAPEDSYGKFVMKKPAKALGQSVADSIQMKDPTMAKVVAPKISKFQMHRSPPLQPENLASLR